MVLPATGTLRASVVLLHGYAARGSVHLADARSLVDEHTEVVLPDAPGHGARDDGRLARIAALPDDPRRAAILAIAREWSAELPSLAADRLRAGADRVGLVGISMGGFAALATLGRPEPFAAVCGLLTAPTLVDPAAVPPARPPLLIGLAGRDAAVPPEPGRRFARDLGAELHEYPESEHLMRAEDWRHLWQRTAAFLRRHLGSRDG